MIKQVIKFSMLILFLGSASLISAQDRIPPADRAEMANLSPEERAKKQTERMTKQLELSEEQSAQVLEINLSFIPKMQEAKGRKAKKEVMKERDEELKAVLSEDQYNKLREGQKKMNRRKRKRGNG